MSLTIIRIYNKRTRQRSRWFNYYITFVSLLLLLLFPSFEIFAQGNLLITPRRVVFEGSKRSMDVNLANTGQDTAIYAISIVQVRMKDDGGFENITEPDPGQKFADRYIRFFPRTVTLPPNEAQTLKIQVVRSNELTEGEYRSHFYFRAVPKVGTLGEDAAIVDSTTISVNITSIFGITIPVIIRSGSSTTQVSLTDPSFEFVNDTVPSLGFVFNRIGNMSVYGDITVDYVSTQGNKTRVGTANGVAVYTPNLIRKFRFNLKKVTGIDYKTGKLIITYSAASEVKPAKYAEVDFALGK
jgi:hypothetical protein